MEAALKKSLKSGLFRYGLAVLTFAVIVAITALLRIYSIKINLTIPVFIGTFVVSWFAGLRPGLLLTILISATSIYLNPIPPDTSLSNWAFGHFTVFALFVFIVLLISGRKSVETRLRESGERYRLLFENNPFPMWVYDLETLRFMAVNDAASFFYGYSRDEFLHMTIKDIRPVDEIPVLLEDLANTVDKIDTSGVWKHRKNDGSLLDVEITSHRLIFDGRPARLVLAMDVTERKSAQESLAYSAAIISSSDDAIFGKTLDGIFTSWNPGAEKMFGYTADEVIGSSMLDFFPGERVQEENELLIRLAAGGSVTHLETVRMHKDGRLIDVSITASPISDTQGKIIGVSKVVRDITESKAVQDEVRRLNEELEQRVVDRTAELEAANDKLLKEIVGRQQAEEILKQSEESTRLIIDTAYDAFIAIDSKGKILTWNTQAEATFGWPREEMIGNKLSEKIIPQQHRQAHERGLRRVASTGHGSVMNQRIEITALHRDEHEFPVELTIWPLKTGKTYTFNAFIRDITERRRSEGKIQKLHEDLEHRAVQLEEANRELEAFSYSVSHDLRAPLRAVNGFAGMVLEDFSSQLPAEGRRYLERIRNGGQQMGELIDDLLTFSRLSRQPMGLQTVDMEKLAQSVVTEQQSQTDGRVIEFRIGHLPPCIGDKALLKLVWVNLLSNAVKYTGNEEQASIEIDSTNENGESVYFIRDNGVGFDMKYAHKLFGVFQRLHRADEFEGTGVGLANVQRIIFRHGGRVWADAEMGRGATFYFTLGAEPKI